MITVFDIDDTLYLEREYVRSGFRAVAHWAREEFGVAGLAERCRQLFIDGHRGTIFNVAFAELGMPTDQQTLNDAIHVYRHHRPEICLLPDARQLLDQLASTTSHGLAVISDGPLISQQRKVEALGLSQWTTSIILTDQWGREYWKPHHRAFAEVERLFGVSPTECLYVADNPRKDFHAPLARGWQTVRIRRPGGEHHACPLLREAPPGTEVASLAELLALPVDSH